MATRLTILLTMAMVLGAMAVGCGDDDGSSNGSGAGGGSEAGSAEESDSSASEEGGAGNIPTASLGKQAYVKKASAACRKERQNLVNEAARYVSKQSAANQPQAVVNAMMAKEVVVPTVEAEMKAIRSLGAPAGDEAEIEAILAAQQEGIDEVNELERAKSFDEILAPFAAANKLIREYGFTSCTN